MSTGKAYLNAKVDSNIFKLEAISLAIIDIIQV